MDKTTHHRRPNSIWEVDLLKGITTDNMSEAVKVGVVWFYSIILLNLLNFDKSFVEPLNIIFQAFISLLTIAFLIKKLFTRENKKRKK